MISFWEKTSFTAYDYIIVGSGITGLSTAISLKEANPLAKIAILERGILPSGASTKNAGFACYGSAEEILSDIELVGEERALELVSLRKKGLDLLRHRLGDEAIGYEEWGGGELIDAHDPITLEQIAGLNKKMFDIFGKEVFTPNISQGVANGFDLTNYCYYVQNNIEGQIDSGKMMYHLIQLAMAKGVMIYTGSEVKEIQTNADGVSIEVWSEALNSTYTFTSRKATVCTNAFIKKLYPQFDVKPGRGQVLITEPIADLKFKGIFHFDQGYFYFRNVGNRILFGGGRNLDFEGETTDAFELNDKIQQRLEHYLQKVIIPNTLYKIEQRWAGIMAFGQEKWPILHQVNEHIVVAGRLNGMGIAIGSEIGRQAAEMLNDLG